MFEMIDVDEFNEKKTRNELFLGAMPNEKVRNEKKIIILIRRIEILTTHKPFYY